MTLPTEIEPDIKLYPISGDTYRYRFQCVDDAGIEIICDALAEPGVWKEETKVSVAAEDLPNFARVLGMFRGWMSEDESR